MKKLLIFLLLLFLSTDAMAAFVAVLETMADGDAKDSVSLLDRQYLTNVLREQAVKELPAELNFTIMTRENINAMLPPGKAIEDCEGSCLAETGRNISADYVCQARVGRFGKSLTLSAELYETAGNKLITSFNGRGNDVEELLKLIEDRSPAFFRRVKELTGMSTVVPSAANVDSNESLPATQNMSSSSSMVAASAEQGRSEPAEVSSSSVNPGEQSHVASEQAHVIPSELTNVIPALSRNLPADSSSKVGESIPVKVNDEPSKKSGIAGKVVLGIGVAATVAGTLLAVVGNNKAKDAYDKGGKNIADLEKNKDDAKSGQTLRGVGIGLAIAGAVGIGVSFVF